MRRSITLYSTELYTIWGRRTLNNNNSYIDSCDELLSSLDAQISQTKDVLTAVDEELANVCCQRRGDERLLNMMNSSVAKSQLNDQPTPPPKSSDPLRLLLSQHFTTDPKVMSKLLISSPAPIVSWACAHNAKLLRSLKKLLNEGSTLKGENERRKQSAGGTYLEWFSGALLRLREKVIYSPSTCDLALRRRSASMLASSRHRQTQTDNQTLWEQHLKGLRGRGGGSGAPHDAGRLVTSMRRLGLHKRQNH